MSDFPVTIFHNPACGTSRNALAILRAGGYRPEVVPYLEAGWTRAQLAELLTAMKAEARDLLREKGTPAEALGLLDPAVSDETILDAMIAHPILVNRPIVVTPLGAALCRPSEKVLDLMETRPESFTKEDGEVVALAKRPQVVQTAPMTEPVIRPATLNDAEALARVGRQTFIDTFVAADGFAIPYPADDLAAFLDASFEAGAIRTKLQEPGAAWWVAERDGELLAFANTGPNTLPHPEARPSHAELRRLYVAKSAQGLGLGTTLLKVALDWMEAHTDGPLWIGVWSGNLKAQKLYEAYGFSKAGEYQYPVGGWRDDEFILRRG